VRLVLRRQHRWFSAVILGWVSLLSFAGGCAWCGLTIVKVPSPPAHSYLRIRSLPTHSFDNLPTFFRSQLPNPNHIHTVFSLFIARHACTKVFAPRRTHQRRTAHDWAHSFAMVHSHVCLCAFLPLVHMLGILSTNGDAIQEQEAIGSATGTTALSD